MQVNDSTEIQMNDSNGIESSKNKYIFVNEINFSPCLDNIESHNHGTSSHN